MQMGVSLAPYVKQREAGATHQPDSQTRTMSPQSGPICAPRSMIAKESSSTPNGGYTCVRSTQAKYAS